MASFYLEFILLPTRMLAVYITIYFLLPKYLLNRKYYRFLIGYAVVLLVAGILQRVFIHLFYENLLLNDASNGLFSLRMLVQAVILINTTSLLVLGIKLLQLLAIANNQPQTSQNKILEIRSNRRTHRVNCDLVLYVEGLGNYVTYHMLDKSRITSYGTIKSTLDILPDHFVRVHKSYIVNKDHISSYDGSSIDVKHHLVPRGKSITDELLLQK